MSIRQWHTYIGLFIAPSVLLFALTGALQLFNLHEAHGQYQPPAIVEKLSSVHKEQVFAFGEHHDQAPSDASPPAGPQHDEETTALSTVILRYFFLAVALCLALSTALGLWMGLTRTAPKPVAWVLVAAGTLIPVCLLLF